MKKYICTILAALMLPVMPLVSGAETAQNTDFSAYTVIEGEEVYRQDFEGEVEEGYTPDSRFAVKRDMKGSNALVIDAASAYIATNVLGPELDSYVIEADVYQQSCNGSTNAAMFFGARCQSNGEGYRFFYSDVNRFDPETKGLTGTDNLRDRIGLARSTGSHNIGTWNIAGISDELGILDTAARAFSDYVHFKMTVTDLFLKMEAYSSSGKLLQDYTLPIEVPDTLNGTTVRKDMLAKGGFMVGAHSSVMMVDNIVIKKVGVAKEAKIAVPQPVMLTGGEYDISVVSEANAAVPEAQFAWEYDGEALEIAGGKITPKKPGKYTVRASYGDVLSAAAELTVADVYPFESFEVVLDKNAAFSGSPVNVSIKGTIGGQEYTTDKDLQISSGAGNTEGSVLTAAVPGEHSVKVTYNGITKETPLYVSALTGGRAELAKEKAKVGEAVAFSVYATDGGERKLSAGEFTVQADPGLLEQDEAVIGETTGEKNILVTVDRVLLPLTFTVEQITDGLIFAENFEDENWNEFFAVPPEYLCKDGENTVMKLSDQFSPYFGHESWRNYTVSGRVKITQYNLVARRYNTSFGVYIRQTEPEEKMTGGHKGIPFAYCVAEQDKYLRVGTQAGTKADFTDGGWYDFSVTAHENQFIFTIGGATMYYNVSERTKGGFTFAAENMTCYLDDISVTRMPNKFNTFEPVSLEVLNPSYAIDKYERRQVQAMTAVAAVDKDGRREYVTYDADMKWSIKNGNGTLTDSNMFRFGDGTKAGDTAVLTGTYKGMTCAFTVIAEDNYQDDVDYVKQTYPIRKTDFMYKLLHSAETGVELDNSKLYYLSYMTGLLFMHPTRMNYDRELKWLASVADFETATKGQAVGGGDFVNSVMLLVKHELQGVLDASDEAWQEIDDFILREQYATDSAGMSENHRLVYFVNAILAGELFPDRVMFNGKLGKDLRQEYIEYFVDWINYRYQHGMLEYDSTYLGVDLCAMELLYNYTTDSSLKKMAADFMDYLYADSVQDTIEDRLAGAHGRTYFNTDVLAKFFPLSQKFDLHGEKFNEVVGTYGVQPAIFAHTDFMPDDIVIKIARDESAYANKERKTVYHLPDDPKVTQSLKKYTYRTADYTMGSIVEYENPFHGLELKGDKYQLSSGTWKEPTWVGGGHQEIPMSVVYAGNDKRFITYGHPGPAGVKDVQGKHAYFSGFYNYQAFRFMQNENTMIGMYYIDDPSHLQFTHFYLPKTQFERVDEEDSWIFIKQDDTFTAIKPMKDGNSSNQQAYRWGDKVEFSSSKIDLSQSEVIIDSKYCAFVMQVVNSDEYEGSFEDFKADMKKLPVSYTLQGNGTLRFTDLKGNQFEAVYDGNVQTLNGERIDFEQYKLQDSKYMQADWMDGYITLRYGDEVKVITPAAMPLAKEDVKQLSDSIKNIPVQLRKNGHLGPEQQIEAMNLNALVEQIMGCGDEYVQDILWNQLTASAEEAAGIWRRNGIQPGVLAERVDKLLGRYVVIPDHGERVKQIISALSGGQGQEERTGGE